MNPPNFLSFASAKIIKIITPIIIISFQSLTPMESPLLWVRSLSPPHWRLSPVCLVCCSVAKSCPALCNPMNCSTPGFPVLHYPLEFTQTLVYWVGDAIQPSHPLSPPSLPALNLSQHQQGLKSYAPRTYHRDLYWSTYHTLSCEHLWFFLSFVNLQSHAVQRWSPLASCATINI